MSAGEKEYVVYMDGLEVRRFADEEDAKACVRLYDGDHAIWYEEEEVDERD